MVENTKKAFTIIEMIIAMLIVTIAMMAVTPVLTQSKPDIKKTAIKGQYACWRGDDGQLYQMRCDERACPPLVNNLEFENMDEYRVSGNQCTFELDHRPAHFFIAAIGSGGLFYTDADQFKRAVGQTKTSQNPLISNSLKIEVPCAYGCGLSDYSPTVVYSDSASAEIIAASGGNVLSNGLAPDNIKTCHLISEGDCRSGHGSQEGCVIVEKAIPGTQNIEKQIQIIGCDILNEFGDIEPELISFNDLSTKFSISGTGVTATKSSIIPGVYPSAEENHSLVYTVDGADYRLAFDLLDSSYTTEKQAIGETQGFQYDDLNVYKTLFKKILLYAVSRDRNSTLIQFLINNEFGNLGKNGAVLILW